MMNVIKAALTHDGHLVQRPVRLPRLRPRNKIPQSDGAQRDETEVDPIQERPGHLHRAEHCRRRNKEKQQHQNHQQHKVDDGGRARLHPRTVQEADGSEDQRVHEPLDAGGEHQHGEGDADQSVEDGEGFPSVGQRSGVTITWRLMKKTEGDRGGTERTKDSFKKPSFFLNHVCSTCFACMLFHFGGINTSFHSAGQYSCFLFNCISLQQNPIVRWADAAEEEALPGRKTSGHQMRQTLREVSKNMFLSFKIVRQVRGVSCI